MKTALGVILTLALFFFMLCSIQDQEQDLNRLRAKKLKLERDIEVLKSEQVKAYLDFIIRFEAQLKGTNEAKTK